MLLAAAAIGAIHRAHTTLVESGADEQLTAAIAGRIAAPYWRRLEELSRSSDDPDERQIAQEIQNELTASIAQAEQTILQRLREVHAIDHATEKRLSRELSKSNLTRRSG